MTISLPSSPSYRAGRWRLVSNAARFASPLTGIAQSVGRPGDYWACEMVLPPFLMETAQDWAGVLASLAGGADAAYVRPPMRWLGKPSGFTLAVNGGSQVGSTLNVTANQNGVTLPRGLFLSFETGTFRSLHILKASATTNGSGGAALSIAPAIRRSPANAAAINVTDPSCEMEIADPSIDILNLQDSVEFGLSIQWRERVVA